MSSTHKNIDKSRPTAQSVIRKPIMMIYFSLLATLLFAPYHINAVTMKGCSTPFMGVVGTCHTWTDPSPNLCHNLSKFWNDKFRSYEVKDGCCSFYKYVSSTRYKYDFLMENRHSSCRQRFFRARNRKDDWIKVGQRHEISSFKCAPTCEELQNPA